MDEARAEQLGLTPLTAQLASIDAISTKADLARHFARAFKLNLITPVVGFVDADAERTRRRSSTCSRAAWACPIATTT